MTLHLDHQHLPDRSASAILADIHASLDQLISVDERPEGMPAAEWMGEVERVARRADALVVRTFAQIEADASFTEAGHMNAKGLARDVCDISASDAVRRARVARMRVDLPAVAASHDAGQLSPGKVNAFARVHANRRVRSFLPDAEPLLHRQALSFPLRDFQRLIAEWERLADQDGAHKDAERNHARRKFRFTNDFDGNWGIDGNLAAAQGAAAHAVYAAFVQAEYEADWVVARDEFGEAAHHANLPRSQAQREADAFVAMCMLAAEADGPATAQPMVNIVIDQQTFEDELTRMAGADPHVDPNDYVNRTCMTEDGHRIDAADAVAAALIGHVRRVVIDEAGVVINLGRKQRLFTGSARIAAKLHATSCVWPGCLVPVSACEIDHRRPWAHGGRTDQDNADPLCGAHNRLKQADYHVRREADGTYSIVKPSRPAV